MNKENLNQNTFLGIELGSTRIKACLIDETFTPIAAGGYEWENKLENGYWTYDLALVREGLQACFAALQADVRKKYGVPLTKVDALGISGMMHGYLAFDENDNLLVPFRTWRNTTTEQAAAELRKLFCFNIPQRWSIAHLYQAILNGEEHLPQVRHITTLAGYVHYLLTGNWEIGVCDGSGMFPIRDNDYDPVMLDKFDRLIATKEFPWKIRDILPQVRLAGHTGSVLSAKGARLLDPTGTLQHGIPMCPPEGDGGTGMVATNSVKEATGNVSAGTSVFSMLVLERPLTGTYPEIDVVTTPDAHPVAMVHSNNGSSELDLWVKMFDQFAALLHMEQDKGELYQLLYTHALTGEDDCGGVIAYNFLANEPVAAVEQGKPAYYRTQNSHLTLANFFRAQLYAAVAALKFGMEILTVNENVTARNFNAHGGLFKVKGVAQQFLADALNTPVSVSETAGEGGAWGMALLAAYMNCKGDLTLGDWLENRVFGKMEKHTVAPAPQGFDRYFEEYKKGIAAFYKD